jgi:hypothetical protein
MIKTRNEIDQMTLTQARKALKQLNKEYKLDATLTGRELYWPLVDDITLTVIWLEDRIELLEGTEP